MENNDSNEGLTVRQSEILMAAVIIARSTSFVISKIFMGTMEPFNILAIRFLTAFNILLALFHKRFASCTRRTLRDGILLGLTYSIVMSFEMLGIGLTESSLASLIENSAFMLVPILEIVLLHEFPKRKVVIGMVLAFVGVLVLNFGPGAVFNRGCIYLLVAMTFYAVAIYETSIYAKETDPLLVGIIQIGTMGVTTLIETLIFEDFRLPSDGKEWAMILMLAVVCSVFGFTLQPVAQRKLAADRAGIFSALNPLAAVIWGYLILSEPLTPTKIIGGALILVGILLPMVH